MPYVITKDTTVEELMRLVRSEVQTDCGDSGCLVCPMNRAIVAEIERRLTAEWNSRIAMKEGKTND